MPFWQPRSSGFVERIWVMMLSRSVADAPWSMRTPVRVVVEQKSVSGSGPLIVN